MLAMRTRIYYTGRCDFYMQRHNMEARFLAPQAVRNYFVTNDGSGCYTVSFVNPQASVIHYIIIHNRMILNWGRARTRRAAGFLFMPASCLLCGHASIIQADAISTCKDTTWKQDFLHRRQFAITSSPMMVPA